VLSAAFALEGNELAHSIKKDTNLFLQPPNQVGGTVDFLIQKCIVGRANLVTRGGQQIPQDAGNWNHPSRESNALYQLGQPKG